MAGGGEVEDGQATAVQAHIGAVREATFPKAAVIGETVAWISVIRARVSLSPQFTRPVMPHILKPPP
jgi:hypothetical protein